MLSLVLEVPVASVCRVQTVSVPGKEVDSARVVVVMANDCCHGSKSWAQSSWFSSSALCLRAKNPI